MSGPRVGLIGARRKRQGLGPFVARDLRAAGAEVSCVLGTRGDTAEAAVRQLAEACGVEARGYTDLEQMLRAERLDAIAILSPSETHEAYLERALLAGLHVLCEKPLVWGGTALARRASSFVERYAERGLLLWENCQWPYTLPAFRELHPGAPTGAPERFAMRLSPNSTDLQALGDAMPHPLSLLQAIVAAGPGRIGTPSFEADDARLRVSFEYAAGDAHVAVEVELVRAHEVPRVAAYALDGCWVHRRVRLPDYEICFGCDDRLTGPLDPLSELIRAFVGELETLGSGSAPRSSALADRLEMLETLVLAFAEAQP
ncbi:MAG: Gfo/Idh/MocA family oxidoreductase [Myxococcota bacterium]